MELGDDALDTLNVKVGRCEGVYLQVTYSGKMDMKELMYKCAG